MSTPQTFWAIPPRGLVLPLDEVHVWRAELDVAGPDVESLRGVLSQDEQERASRFRFERDQKRFITAHALLRLILGRYLNTGPGELMFCYGEHDKPALVSAPGRDVLHFNMAHSDGLALYAFAYNRLVGIDLERIRTDIDYDGIASSLFSKKEIDGLAEIEAPMKPQAFFNCWVRKEAYVKATGKGLSYPLDTFAVSLQAEGAASIASAGHGHDDAEGHYAEGHYAEEHDALKAGIWSLQGISLDPGYAAALAVRGHDWTLRCWQCDIGSFSAREQHMR